MFANQGHQQSAVDAKLAYEGNSHRPQMKQAKRGTGSTSLDAGRAPLLPLLHSHAFALEVFPNDKDSPKRVPLQRGRANTRRTAGTGFEEQMPSGFLCLKQLFTTRTICA